MVELLMDRKTLRGVVFGLTALAVLSFSAGLALGLKRTLPRETEQPTALAPAQTRETGDPGPPGSAVSRGETRHAQHRPGPPASDPSVRPELEAIEAKGAARQPAFAASDFDRVAPMPATATPSFEASRVAESRKLRLPAPTPAARLDPAPATPARIEAPRVAPGHAMEPQERVAARGTIASPGQAGVQGHAGAPNRAGAIRPRLQLDDNLRLAYTVQVGAFANHANAQAHAQALSGRGYPTRIVGVRVGSGRTFALVLVGGYRGFSEALRTADQLDAEGFSAFARSNLVGEESQAAPGASG